MRSPLGGSLGLCLSAYQELRPCGQGTVWIWANPAGGRDAQSNAAVVRLSCAPCRASSLGALSQRVGKAEEIVPASARHAVIRTLPGRQESTLIDLRRCALDQRPFMNLGAALFKQSQQQTPRVPSAERCGVWYLECNKEQAQVRCRCWVRQSRPGAAPVLSAIKSRPGARTKAAGSQRRGWPSARA